MESESKEELSASMLPSPNPSGPPQNEPPMVRDIESQTPMVLVQDARPLDPAQQQRVVNVAYPVAAYGPPIMDDPNTDPLLGCALVGLCFSWIPIVGFITFCVNVNAPHNSLRYSVANTACLISSLIVIFNVIFWSAYRF